MKFIFRWYHPFVLIEKLAERLDADVKKEYAEKHFELPEDYGFGEVHGFKFRNGISFLFFEVTLHKEWKLEFHNDSHPPLQLNFLSEGAVKHNINDNKINYELKPMQSSITSSARNSNQTIIFPKEKKITFASMFVNRAEYFSELINVQDNSNSKILELLFDIEGKNNFFTKSNFAIEIARALKRINSRLNSGIIRSIMVESIVLEMFGFEMRKLQESILLEGKKKKVNLKKEEIKRIKLARDILIDDLTNAPTIVLLSKQVGINQQKLKQQFKMVYGMTINQYLTNARMEYAVTQLDRGCSVKETAGEVGYYNMSHFSRKFKEKFGILPKDYAKSIGSKVTVSNR